MIVEGYAALFGVEDQMHDIVRAGAFAAWLNRRSEPLPMLVEHERRLLAGYWTEVREDSRGLFLRGEIRDDQAGAARARRMIARGIDGLSIGFVPIVAHARSRGRVLTEIELLEVSIVTHPMQPLARLTARALLDDVRPDQRLVRADVAAHEWREALTFVSPPAQALPSDPRAASAAITLPHAAVRPWAPAHLRARRVASGDVAISWVRCARTGDHWGAGDPPLGAPAESYRFHVLDGEIVKREVVVTASSYLYATADQTADFGVPPASLRLRVAQIGADGSPGLNKELTITL